ncbi:MAG: sigma-70 family RNA polymerase sigma factor [Deltaproteobacteria bacterium]|nr:sigma-70 family RNA polymerase sigma factor [Deltaproteobacteria bacterium]
MGSPVPGELTGVVNQTIAAMNTAESKDAPPLGRVVHADPAGRLSDADLVTRVVEGDEWALEVLFRRHASLAIGTATRLLSNASEAEDVAQDSFILAYERISQLRDPAAFKGWFMQIVVHQVHRRMRKRKLLAVLGIVSASTETLEAVALPETSAEVRAELALLEPRLNALKAKDRTAWMLRYVEGYSLVEVAELTSSSLATTKRRISHAQTRLRVRLARGSHEA